MANVIAPIIVIDGLVGAGKSTLLAYLKNNFISPHSIFYDEPVQQYESGGPITLKQYYENPKLHAHQFQLQVIKILKNDISHPLPVYESGYQIHDRHLISCLAFQRVQFKLGLITKSEYEDLKGRVRKILFNYPARVPAAVVYLKLPVNIALDRVARRSRHGEQQISEEYMNELAVQQMYWIKKLQTAYGIRKIIIEADSMSVRMLAKNFTTAILPLLPCRCLYKPSLY